MKYLNPPLADLLAAEYVLGTLQGRARQRFEKLLPAHPSLRRYVQMWELHLNRLADSVPPVTPSPAVWDSLRKRLFPLPPKPRWPERLGLWRSLALGGGLLAGLLAVLLWLSPVSEAPTYLVLISDRASQQPVWMVSASADMRRFYIKNMKPMEMPQYIGCLLWLRPEGSQRYYVLGLLPDKGDDRMLEISPDMRPMLPGQLLVTLEDMSGPLPQTPSGLPRYEGKWMPLKPI